MCDAEEAQDNWRCEHKCREVCSEAVSAAVGGGGNQECGYETRSPEGIQRKFVVKGFCQEVPGLQVDNQQGEGTKRFPAQTANKHEDPAAKRPEQTLVRVCRCVYGEIGKQGEGAEQKTPGISVAEACGAAFYRCGQRGEEESGEQGDACSVGVIQKAADACEGDAAPDGGGIHADVIESEGGRQPGEGVVSISQHIGVEVECLA